MHEAGLPQMFASIGIPSVQKCLLVAGPILALAGIRWLFLHTDRLVDHLFPHWAWEKNLGWLNIRAHRQAEAILRWIEYGVQAALVLALYGIVWASTALSELDQWPDPAVMSRLTHRLPILLVCAGIWLIYLGGSLIPKLRAAYEAEELEKYRAEEAALLEKKKAASGSRLKPVPSTLGAAHVRMPRRSPRL